jgi:2,5-diketo-D-gluconate reductase A
MTNSIPNLTLNDSHTIPQLGFGVFQVPPAETEAAVDEALLAGYRHLDTAAAYRNESGVGAATAKSGIPRDELFVTTKLFNDQHGADKPRRALERSLQQLSYDYVDLYLIHWPAPPQDLYVETWQALVELRDAGLTRSIGVSNFNIDHLQRAIDATGVVPSINQIELHPLLQQADLRTFGAERGILTEAWSPIAQGAVLDDETIVAIASEVERTAAQVVLRWHLQLGNVVIPKSVTPSRIAENFALFDFELSGEQMERIAALDAGERTGPDPATFVLP